MAHIIPKLSLHNVKDTALATFTQDKIDKINANPAFATVNPPTPIVGAKKTQYENALVKADNGTKADTQAKDDRRFELEELLISQAQDCARIANGNLALYLTTGYEAKDTKGNPVGALEAVTDVQLDFGDNTGELIIGWKPMPDADNFTARVYSDVNNPDGSLVKEFIVKKIGKKKTTLTGLPSGQIVFVRVRANGGSTGFGPWSDVSEKRVP